MAGFYGNKRLENYMCNMLSLGRKMYLMLVQSNRKKRTNYKETDTRQNSLSSYSKLTPDRDSQSYSLLNTDWTPPY